MDEEVVQRPGIVGAVVERGCGIDYCWSAERDVGEGIAVGCWCLQRTEREEKGLLVVVFARVWKKQESSEGDGLFSGVWNQFEFLCF